MLSHKEQLGLLGYEINPDPEQPGMFHWRNVNQGSDVSFDSEAGAIAAAGKDAIETYATTAGKVNKEEMQALTEPLTQVQIEAQLDKDGWLSVVVEISLDEMIGLGDIEAMNELIDHKILDDDVIGGLSNISYRVSGCVSSSDNDADYVSGGVLIRVNAQFDIYD